MADGKSGGDAAAGGSKGASPFAATLAALPGRPAELGAALERLAQNPSEREEWNVLGGAISPFEPVEGHSIVSLMATRVLLDSPEILPALRLLASRGVDLDASGPKSPLKTALQTGRGRWAFARALLEAGARVDGSPSEHASPLHEAVGSGDLRGAELLLEFGADVELSDKMGRSPLGECAMRGEVEACGLLLRAGASLDAVDRQGRTALDIAIERAAAVTGTKTPNQESCEPALRAERARREGLALEASTAEMGQARSPSPRL